jgi:transcription initiation factor TFIIIB Brf1 subunit/transcription initiation factor TFIIB
MTIETTNRPVCPHCGSRDVRTNLTDGALVCRKCGVRTPKETAA